MTAFLRALLRVCGVEWSVISREAAAEEMMAVEVKFLWRPLVVERARQ